MKNVSYIAEISSSFFIFFNRNDKNLAILLFVAFVFLISSCTCFAFAESHCTRFISCSVTLLISCLTDSQASIHSHGLNISFTISEVYGIKVVLVASHCSQ